MKKLGSMIIIAFLLMACSINHKPLSDTAYKQSLLQKYENVSAIQMHQGTYFEAKLVVMDRYIRDDQTMYYNYQILMKPLKNLNTKKLNVRLKLSDQQNDYYSGTENQTVFSKITYPINLDKEEDVPCLTYQFSVNSATFRKMKQVQWETMMQDITLELSWGSYHEAIGFHNKATLDTFSGNQAAFPRSFGVME